MSNEPSELELAEIDRLEAEARLLRDRISEAEHKGSKAALGFRSQLVVVEGQLERLKSAHRTESPEAQSRRDPTPC